MSEEKPKRAPIQKKKWIVTHSRTVGVNGKLYQPREEFKAYPKEVEFALSKKYVKPIK